MTGPVGYYRHPSIHGDGVVFVSEDDIWAVPSTGGSARRITSNSGSAMLSRLSPTAALWRSRVETRAR